MIFWLTITNDEHESLRRNKINVAQNVHTSHFLILKQCCKSLKMRHKWLIVKIENQLPDLG